MASTPCDMEIVMIATTPDQEFVEKLRALMSDYDDPTYVGDECSRCGSTVWPKATLIHNHFHRQLTFVMRLQGMSMDTLRERINQLEDWRERREQALAKARMVREGDGR